MNLRGDGKKQSFGLVSRVLYFAFIVTLSLLAFQCVIVGLQSTGEARTLEQLEESGGDLTAVSYTHLTLPTICSV